MNYESVCDSIVQICLLRQATPELALIADQFHTVPNVLLDMVLRVTFMIRSIYDPQI